MARQWYILQDNKKYGPYGEEYMRSFIGEGRLKGDALVWCKGMANWTRLGDTSLFESYVEKQTPAEPLAFPEEGGRRKIVAAGVLVLLVAAAASAWLVFLRGGPAFSEEIPAELGIEAVGTVTHVRDGDTIDILITEVLVPHEGISEKNDTIRFAGIDAEEITFNDKAKREHPELTTEAEYQQTDYYTHAVSAKELVKDLCPVGGKVYLNIDDLASHDRPYRDRYDRIVAVIYVNKNNTWVNVNAKVLLQEYPGYCDITGHKSEFDVDNWLGISGLKITKDPSQMVLTLNDLPSGYTVSREFWDNGFYSRTFTGDSRTFTGALSSICSFISKYTSLASAANDYNINRSFYRESSLPLSENIGDQSFAYQESSIYYFKKAIYFRKANVLAWVETNDPNVTLENLIGYARIMENKMN